MSKQAGKTFYQVRIVLERLTPDYDPGNAGTKLAWGHVVHEIRHKACPALTNKGDAEELYWALREFLRTSGRGES